MQTEIELPEDARRRALGTQARRTQRQAFLITLGYHPLSPLVPGRSLRLAPGAARERTGPGDRCKGCYWFGPLDREGEDAFSRSQRCWINKGERVTRGAATQVRGWWPACADFQGAKDTPGPADR